MPRPRLRARFRAPAASLVAALLLVGAAAGAGVRSAAAAPDPLERALEDEVARQQAQIDQAKSPSERAAVVSRYASRVGRDPSAMSEFLHGRALYYADDKAAARAAMLRALGVDARFWPARVRLAWLDRELGRRVDAERGARLVLDVRPTDRDALEILAGCAMDAKDWGRAIEWTRRIVALVPGDLAPRRRLAALHAENKDWAAAERELAPLRQAAPEDLETRFLLGVVQIRTGRTDAGIGLLESVVHERPNSLEALDVLVGAYESKEDWARVRSTLERMLPFLPPASRPKAEAAIARLRQGPPPRRDPTAPPAPPRRTFEDVLREAEAADARVREDAMITILDACDAQVVPRIPASVLRRVTSAVEPSESVRGIVVKILGRLNPDQILPLLAIALHDEAARVRMIAAETIGKIGRPAGLAYVLPLLERVPDSVAEYQSVRAALTALTGFQDLPAGVDTVAADGVDASREAWRRWSLSDGATEPKLAAIRGLLELREPTPERQLLWFVRDPVFAVMSEAYRAIRAAVRRVPIDPVEKKVFPQFPDVPDAELTRATMRAIQDRVAAWDATWLAERRAYLATPSK